MVKAVFFDVANTLLFKPALFNSIDTVLKDHGYNVPQQAIIEKHKMLSELTVFPDKTSKAFYEKFNEDLLTLLGILPEELLINEIFNACTYQPWQAFDDVSFLGQIKQPVGILSNWDSSLESKLKAFFEVSFSWILGSENEALKKPDLKFFLKMVACSGVNPEEIVYVGDSIRLDIYPASRLGIQAILIDRDNLFSYAPVTRISSLYELSNYL